MTEKIQRRSPKRKPVNIYPNTKTCSESSSSALHTMNTADAAAPSAGEYIDRTYACTVYIMPYCTRIVYRACKVHYASISARSAYVRTAKSTIQLWNALCNITQRPTFFENALFPNTVDQEATRGHGSVSRVLNGSLSMFVFDIS